MAEDKKGKFWAVRDLPEDTIRKIKVYAAQHDLTTAQALEQLVERGQLAEEKRQPETEVSTPPTPHNPVAWTGHVKQDFEAALMHALEAAVRVQVVRMPGTSELGITVSQMINDLKLALHRLHPDTNTYRLLQAVEQRVREELGKAPERSPQPPSPTSAPLPVVESETVEIVDAEDVANRRIKRTAEKHMPATSAAARSN